MIKKQYILVIFALFFSFRSLAQQDISYKNTLFIVPLNLLNSGIRFDFEHELKGDALKRILVAPQFYYRDIYDAELPFRGIEKGSLIGGGMEVCYKKFLTPSSFFGHAYYSLGVSYQYFNLENTELTTSLKSIHLHKTGTHLLVGYQMPISQRLVMDYFVGLGFRYTFDFSDNEMENEFGNFSWNFGYSGPAPLLGFKIGFNL